MSKGEATKKQAATRTTTIPGEGGYELPEELKRPQIKEIVEREKDEVLKKEDSAMVKAAKDAKYLSRLQYIISIAQEKIARGEATPQMEYLKEVAIGQVIMFGDFVLTHALGCRDDEVIKDTIQRLCGCICAGKYGGGNTNYYLRALKNAVMNEKFRTEENMSPTVGKVFRELRRLEEEVRRADGRDPDQITREERYNYLIAHKVSKKAASEYADRTSESLKLIHIDDFNTASSLYSSEPSYDPYEEVNRQLDHEDIKALFNPDLMAKHPEENRILEELAKEGWSVDERVNAGVYMMSRSFLWSESNAKGKQLKMWSFERMYGDNIYQFVSVLTTGKKGKKTGAERKKVVHEIVQRAIEFKDEEMIMAINQITALIFNRRELYKALNLK